MNNLLKTIILTPVLILFLLVGLNAQNQVANGSFTNSGANWSFFAPATGTESYYPETSYGGTISNNIVAEIDIECNLRQTDIIVVPGTTYWFSFRRTRRTGNGAAPNPAKMYVKVYDASNTYVFDTITSTNASWDWQCEVYQFTPSTSKVAIDFGNIVATTLGTLVDDITITPLVQDIVLEGATCQGGNISFQAPEFSGNPDAQYSDYTWTGPSAFTATGSHIEFSNVQLAASGTYSCTMTMNYCLEVTGTYKLTVAPAIFSREKAICSGETFSFYGRLLYQSGDYDTLIKGDGNRCDSLIRLKLQVTPFPDVSLNVTRDLERCAGDTALINVRKPGTGVSYQWFWNSLPLSGETGIDYIARESGRYHLSGTIEGCTAVSPSVRLSVYDKPTATIETSIGAPPCFWDTIALEATEGQGYAYRWEPADAFRPLMGADARSVKGILGALKTPVVLTVYNLHGCQDSDTLTVYTRPCCTVFVPNAFSPDQDGLNDYFKPVLQVGQTVLAMNIFDRYGKQVYNSQGILKGWDGTYENGVAANAGLYMYFIRYNCSDGKIYTKKGDFTLMK